ncbi:MAG: PIN domain-containing protein [Rhodospirillaceae bacterium]|nr:PIN domain-containing protein [Rhodospirillaceae bacterium]MCA8931395.1 PIN domain-containing protein [Rhodospirillaceae bacterium]
MSLRPIADRIATFLDLVALDQALGFEVPRPPGATAPDVGPPPPAETGAAAEASAVDVLVDANILFAAPMRNLLIACTLAGLVRPRWSDIIQEEWTRARRRQEPRLKEERLALLRALVDHTVPEARVDGFEGRIGDLRLRDRNDRHVLAAAIEAGCPVIATRNRKDFRPRDLAPFGVHAADPDEVLGPAAAERPDLLAWAAGLHRAALGGVPMARYVLTLRRERLHRVVKVLKTALPTPWGRTRAGEPPRPAP